MSSSDIHSNDLGLTDKNHACACGSHGLGEHASAHGAPASAEATTGDVFLVDGMTCSHCVSSITEEVGAVAGVDSVSVDLNAGGTSRVTVVSSNPVDPEAVRAAVVEAGYTMATA